jgi:YjbE family integral membrane protein
VLSGDNVIIISLAAAGLPQAQRSKAILMGIIAATMLRILFAGLATQILQTVGLLLAGGILLLWVCWQIWRELRSSSWAPVEATAAPGAAAEADAEGELRKTLVEAIWQIIVADVSMSLDNVLAVAGAAREHPVVLIFGLALSIAMMGAAASFIARLLQKPSLDCLCRPGRHSLHRSRDDLSRSPGYYEDGGCGMSERAERPARSGKRTPAEAFAAGSINLIPGSIPLRRGSLRSETHRHIRASADNDQPRQIA